MHNSFGANEVMRLLELGSPEATRLIAELRQSELGILVGSAVSCWEPTCLFSGRQIADAMFSIVFPPTSRTLTSGEKRLLEESFAKVPFEHVCDRYPDQDRLRSLLSHVFSITRYNPIHEMLGHALVSGRIGTLITTNYDLCIDEVLSRHCNPQVTSIITEDDIANGIDKVRPYFKIHGSADDPSSLVFTLAHESVLPKWKREVLKRTLDGKSLLVVGYSGSDFEICPELEHLGLRQVIWNVRDGEPTGNPARLLSHGHAVAIVGDMKALLSDLLQTSAETAFAPTDDAFEPLKSAFTEMEILEWRAGLLNSIGFPSLALRASRQMVRRTVNRARVVHIRALRHLAQALFLRGKYREAASVFDTACREAQALGEECLQASLLLDVSSAHIAYGNLTAALRCTKKAADLGGRVKDRKEQVRLFGKVLLRYVLILRDLRGAMGIPWSLLLLGPVLRKTLTDLDRSTRSELEQLCHSEPHRQHIGSAVPLSAQALSLASYYALRAGNWHDFYQTRLISDELGTRIEVLTDAYYEPPQAREGYSHLGYIIPLSISKRRELRQRGGPLTNEEFSELRRFLSVASTTGNLPERWKILWLGMRRGWRWRLNPATWLNFVSSFLQCQYSASARIVKFLGGD
jgi:hypothetical protein